MNSETKKYRKYGYDILINNFEPLVREFLINEILIPKYGLSNWLLEIPKSVIDILKDESKILNANEIDNSFDELYLWCLKEIIVQKNIYDDCVDLFGELSKENFISTMDELNEHRRKIAHAKSNYTIYDFEILLELLNNLCLGEKSKNFKKYLLRENFKTGNEIPISFYEENKCLNNLPIEDYDLDGGFVGRRKEVIKIKSLLRSNQDRIITITGAGGLGKTATALKCAYSIMAEVNNPYDSIIWFSAKENKLTSEYGIVQIESQISDYFLLLKDILKILDSKTYEIYKDTNANEEFYRDTIYKNFSKTRSLLIIDNLETIVDLEIINFIKDVPRPSQVLITSRKGLGELERRYPLSDFLLPDAVKLFRIIAKERNRNDLLKLQQSSIEEFVKSIRSYPLLIKWSIGKICLGMEIDKAFNEIYSGDSEISKFVFNDIFNLLSNNSKKSLYSMVVFGDKPISKHLIQHMASLGKEEVDDAIEELIISSFIYSEIKDGNTVTTHYLMLLLTRGFVQSKLDDEKLIQKELQSKYRNLSLQIEETESSKAAFNDSLSFIGIKTEEDKIAYNYVKTAKNYVKIGNDTEAKEYFDLALRISPKLSYTLSEYGKFESSLEHHDSAEKYHLKACHIDDLNYNAHFSYGVFLRKQNRIDDAIHHLERTKELNEKFLPVYNELGRALSFNGRYEEANINFKISLEQQHEFINYRHLNITLNYKSDNYKRWAESYLNCKNYDEGKKILLRSFEIIVNANKNYRYDQKNQILEKMITKDIGKILIKNGDFELGKKFLLKATNVIYSQNGDYALTDKIAVSSYLILISNLLQRKEYDKKEIIMHLDNADKLCTDTRDKNKITIFRNQLSDIGTQTGIIKFYNLNREFGVIHTSDGKEYTFVFNSIVNSPSLKELSSVENRKVTFKVKKNTSKNYAEYVEFL